MGKDTFKNNFPIYLNRLCHHLVMVKLHGSIISYLDLSHSLRCLADVKGNVDMLFKDENYICKFGHINNRRKIKGVSSEGVSILEKLVYNGVTTISLCFSDKVIENSNENFIFPNHQNKAMTFTQWLGCEVASFKTENGPTITITREDFIRRIANRFGGSHPYETDFNQASDMNKKQIYKQIDYLHAIKITGINYGFLLIRNFAEEFALSSLEFFNGKPQYLNFCKYKEELLNENNITQNHYN